MARSSSTVVLRRLFLETSVDHQSKLVQNPLRDVKPAQYAVDVTVLEFLVPVTVALIPGVLRFIGGS